MSNDELTTPPRPPADEVAPLPEGAAKGGRLDWNVTTGTHRGQSVEVLALPNVLHINVGGAMVEVPHAIVVRAEYDRGVLDEVFERWARARGLVQAGTAGKDR